jgi:hypothetical protein
MLEDAFKIANMKALPYAPVFICHILLLSHEEDQTAQMQSLLSIQP